MKIAGLIILYFLGAVAGYFVLGYTLAILGIAALPLFHLQSKINANYGIIQKTYDPNNVIYNYEWFKSRYEAIQAIDVKIANAQQAESDYNSQLPKDRTIWSYALQTESGRLHSVVLGLQNQKQDLVAEYNARAKEANRNIFMNNLPLYIQL